MNPPPFLSKVLLAACITALGAGCATAPREGPDQIALPSYVQGFSETPPGEAMPEGWRPWTLSRLKKATQYELVSDDAGRSVIRASASSSASGLVHPLKLDPKTYPLLQWQWKVSDLIAKADNTQKHTEDSPVRIVVSFDGDMDSLSFDDRLFFDTMRVATGQQLPYATLMYIWENRAARDSIIPNRHTGRIKMLVAESGRERVGEWHSVMRNVYEDFKRAFGEEPGRITGVAIMTDTDNTGENARAYYGDIVFRRVPPPRVTLSGD